MIPKTRRQRLVDYLVALPVCGLAMISILAFMGEVHWFLDLWSAFRVQYFVLALVSVALAAIARRRSWLAAAAATGALNGLCLLPFVCGSPFPAADGAQPLRISFHNINYANQSFEILVRELREGEPDLIAIAELTPETAAALETGLAPYRPILLETRNDAFGLGVYSKDGAIAHKRMLGGTSPAAEIELSKNGVDYQVLVVHPIPPVSSAAAESRNHSLEDATAWAQDKSAAIIIGDFNATPWSANFKEMLGSGALVNSQTSFGLQTSWPSQMWPISIPIDHCLHSPQLTTVERRVGPFAGSDHRVLRVRLAPRR